MVSPAYMTSQLSQLPLTHCKVLLPEMRHKLSEAYALNVITAQQYWLQIAAHRVAYHASK